MGTIAKYTFIDPPGSTKGINIGIGYLVSSLIESGIEDIKVLDFNNKTDRIDERLNDALNRCSFLGFSLKSSNDINSILNNPILKKRKNMIYVCGGPHITLDGLNFMQKNKIFDLGVIGEGEETIKKISECIETGKDFSGIENTYYRNHRKLFECRCENLFIKDLDKLPYPNYGYFDSFNGKIDRYPLLTSRGCPYNCIYCSVNKISGKIWRYRKPENVVDEILNAKKKYKINKFSILDDNFTVNIERAQQICEIIIEKKVNLKWDCPNGIRADKINEKLARLMKKSGCERVFLGIETLDDEIFNSIKKGEGLKDIKNGIKILKNEGIGVGGFFIIGLPGSTLEKEKMTIDLAQKLQLDQIMWNMLIPYPGTEIWDWVNKNGKNLRDWKEGFHFGQTPKVIFETNDFKEAERLYAYYYAHIKSYNYSIFFNQEDKFVTKAVKIFKAINKYDRKDLHKHIFKLISSKI